VWSLWLKVKRLGFRVLELQVLGPGFRALGSGFRAHGGMRH
jgi:hypothetical protein